MNYYIMTRTILASRTEKGFRLDVTSLLKCTDMIYAETYHQEQKVFDARAVAHTILSGPKGQVTEARDLAKSPHSFL